MRLLSAILPLLPLGCADTAPRGLTVLGEPEGHEPTPWKPMDTGDTAAAPWTSGLACGADLSAAPEPGDLALTGCVRITPEPGDEGDTGYAPDSASGLDTASSGSLFAPMPCGFFNLVGLVDLRGGPDQPEVLYCDADEDGGVRYTVASPAEVGLMSSLLVPGVCWVDAESGGMLEQSSSTLAFWVDLTDLYVGSSVKVAVLGDDGALQAAPEKVEGTDGARRALAIPGDSPALLIQDMEGELSLVGLEGGQTGPVASGVWSVGAASTGDGLIMATCADDDRRALTVTSLDLLGATRWSMSPLGATCAWATHPDVVVDGDRIAVTWDDDDLRGTLSVLSDAGAELAQLGLGKDSAFPRAAFYGGQLYSIDGSGTLTLWSRDGEELGSWRHPAIAGHAGQVAGLRLQVADAGLTFLLMGSESVPTAGGHVNTYSYIEASGAPLPSP